MGQKTQEKTAFLIGMFFIFLSAVLHIFVKYAYDDFYYLTFLDDGFVGFLKAMIDHHKNLTGRSFVHLVLCPLLQWDMIPFKVFNVCLIGGVCGIGAALCRSHKMGFWQSFTLLASMFWLIGISVLADGVLWGAGSLNYLFPAFFIVLCYTLIERVDTFKGILPLCVLAFFGAATVEMSGLLVIVAFIYSAIAQPVTFKNNKSVLLYGFVCSVCGYATLFLTGGIGKRFAENDYASVTIWERIITNFSLFSRKICSINGLAVVVFIALLSVSVWLYKQRKFKLLAYGVIALALLAVVALRICVHNLFVMLAALTIFVFLCYCAVMLYTDGERTAPFFMLCLTISLGICVVSPVVAFRMLLPGGVFLIMYTVRVITLCDLSDKSRYLMTVILSAAAIVAMVITTVKYAENCAVVHRNEIATKNHTAGETLLLTNVPDELYGNGTVPTTVNFGASYIAHYGLGNTEIQNVNPVETSLYSEGTLLSQTGVRRGGVWYIPVRSITEICDASVSWELACAVVRKESETFRFSAGSYVADLGEGFVRTAELSYPVRMINEVTYISIGDFNRLFNTAVTTRE